MFYQAIFAGLATFGAITICVAAEPPALIKASDLSGVVDAMQATGYKAELKPNKNRKPFVESATNGSSFALDFYNCDDNDKLVGCKAFTFSSW